MRAKTVFSREDDRVVFTTVFDTHEASEDECAQMSKILGIPVRPTKSGELTAVGVVTSIDHDAGTITFTSKPGGE